jgi:hypothetical protein
MKGVRELLRKSFDPIHVYPGDTLSLEYLAPDGTRTKLVEARIDREYTFTEGVAFEADAGVFGEGRALGGAFVE